MDIGIDEKIDKEIYSKRLTEDKIINITGEGGSGKSTYSKQYKDKDGYVVIDYDEIILEPKEGTIEYDLKKFLIKKYGEQFFKQSISNSKLDDVKDKFTIMYLEILNYFKDSDKVLVLDGTQLRFIKDVEMIKGEVIVLRTSLNNCLKNSIKRFVELNPKTTKEEITKYSKKRYEALKKLNPLMNNLLLKIEQLPDLYLDSSKSYK